MYTSLPTWLALSAALLPPTSAFYPYHYGDDRSSTSGSRRTPIAPTTDSTARSITLPLQRLPTPLRSRQNAYNIVNSKEPQQENSVAIDQDGGDLSYMVAVTFGDSKEEYHLLLDSAASNTWVMGQDCTTEACGTHTLFGEGDSSTLKTDTTAFSVTYGTGSSSGTLATDTLHIASLSPTLTFGLATNVSSEFRSYPMDGILGIGRGTTDEASSDSIPAPQIMDVLTADNLIGAKIYGIHLSRGEDGLMDGELNLGEVNTERFSGDLNYINCVDNGSGFWEIPLEDASVDGKALGLSDGRTAIMDTGTSYILVPQPDAEIVHAAIQGYQQDGETFFVPCDTTSVVQFSFGQTRYNISTADWVGGTDDVLGLCRSNIVGRQTFGEKQWLIGDVFMKNVYSVFDFDKGRVGLGVKSDRDEVVEANSTTSGTATASAEASQTSGSGMPTSAAEGQSEEQQGGAVRSSASLTGVLVILATVCMMV